DPRPAELLESWVGADIGVALPRVLDRGRTGRQSWTVDRRIPGRPLADVLRETPRADRRRRLLLALVDAACHLRALPIGAGGFRALCTDDPPALGLADLLDRRIGVATALTWTSLERRVPALGRERARLGEELSGREVAPAFVHLDLYPGNALVEGNTITGVCDISVHALAADPVLDEVGAVCLLDGYEGARQDSRVLRAVLAERLGDEGWLVDSYRRFYGFYYAMDAALLDWAGEQFRP
ncbi:MAG: phosphotransferase, partial [Propionibacterium sp.]|nr:phosphotransferase [Propionibacterium sp.]